MGQQVYILQQDDVNKILTELSEIKDFMRGLKNKEVEQSISHKEAADFLNIHINTLARWTKDGTYPPEIIHWNGPKKEYYKSELHALKQRK